MKIFLKWVYLSNHYYLFVGFYNEESYMMVTGNIYITLNRKDNLKQEFPRNYIKRKAGSFFGSNETAAL